ncbi:MAG: GyrI-like domain-containing protein [Candidatus Edwardsbacteria bacterium]|jgi:hypothetical protein|nr:GyrI-like domain-containing protein [Candidatus Edwardsbacteria bacterium]
MLKKILIAAGILVIVVVAALLVAGYVMMKGPDLARYDALKRPRIVQKPDQRMLQVEAVGDPNTAGLKAFALLFQTYYRNARTKGPVAPLARWPQPFDTPQDQWVGRYALPVPESLEKLKETPAAPGMAVTLTTWQYGEVAEVLHVGPYSAAAPSVEKLMAFIDASGYVVAGPHEEEYLRGPGLFGKGDPDKYHTIIRYRVEKKTPPPTPR